MKRLAGILLCFVFVNLHAQNPKQFLEKIQEKDEDVTQNLISQNGEVVDSLSKIDAVWVEPERVFEKPKEDLSKDELASIESDKKFLEKLPKSYEEMSPKDMKKFAKQIESQLEKLIQEKEALLKKNASKEVIEEKEKSISSLNKEKEIVDLSIKKDELEVETDDLKVQRANLKRWIIAISAALAIMVLAIIALLQRKTIKVQDVEIERQLQAINKKNTYLEYAARIIRHDMHSGINTYIPRGLSSLQKRINQETIDDLKIAAPLQMIQDGLAHTQRVYKNVYEFTNLVKVKADFKKEVLEVKPALERFLSATSYKSQVEVSDLGTLEVNDQLFCSALDNLIRNGLKYNTSDSKRVKIYREKDIIVVEDNGVGMSKVKFEEVIKAGVNFETETGLGLGIAKAIIEEHGFSITCDSSGGGTKVKISI